MKYIGDGGCLGNLIFQYHTYEDGERKLKTGFLDFDRDLWKELEYDSYEEWGFNITEVQNLFWHGRLPL